MADKEKSKRNPVVVAEYEKRAKKLRLGASGDLIKAIWNGFGDSRNLHLDYRWSAGVSSVAFNESYRTLCGNLVSSCETLDDFFCSKLTSVLNTFFGKEETARIRKECELIMECPYSHTIYRPSYRSRRAADYAGAFFGAMVSTLDFITFDMPLEQVLIIKSEPFSYGSWEHMQHIMNAKPSGLDNRIALELRNGNEKIFSLIEEAILGDNSEITLDHNILKGIVKSGNTRAIELLGKLLLPQKGRRVYGNPFWKPVTAERLTVIFILPA